MKNIRIRNLQENDLVDLEKLYQHFWDEKSNIAAMKDRFSKLSTNKNYVFLVAEVNGEIAGTIMGIICNELYGECKPFMLMENLVVHKSFRKGGVGRALVEMLETRGRQNGCYQILFITEANRMDTVHFYESLGFDSKKNIGFKRAL